MSTSSADVATDRPARYGKQLVAHLGRRTGGEWSEDESSGWITFDAGRATVTCSDAALHLHIDGDDPARLEDVVGRHLVRFGVKDELTVQWTRDDGTPGSSQQNTGD